MDKTSFSFLQKMFNDVLGAHVSFRFYTRHNVYIILYSNDIVASVSRTHCHSWTELGITLLLYK